MIVLIVKAFDPILIVLAVIGGLVSREWWHVTVSAVVVGVVIETLLVNMSIGRAADPLLFTMGVVGAMAWASLAFALKRWWQRRK